MWRSEGCEARRSQWVFHRKPQFYNLFQLWEESLFLGRLLELLGALLLNKKRHTAGILVFGFSMGDLVAMRIAHYFHLTINLRLPKKHIPTNIFRCGMVHRTMGIISWGTVYILKKNNLGSLGKSQEKSDSTQEAFQPPRTNQKCDNIIVSLSHLICCQP